MNDLPSADRLRRMLAQSEAARGVMREDAAYYMQMVFTCQLLDVVDKVTDPVTAAMITDLIYERMTGDGVSEAAQRIRDSQEQVARLMREQPRLMHAPPTDKP